MCSRGEVAYGVVAVAVRERVFAVVARHADADDRLCAVCDAARDNSAAVVAHVDDDVLPRDAALHVGHRAVNRHLVHARERAYESRRVGPVNAVIKLPVIRQRVVLCVGRIRCECDVSARGNRRRARGQRIENRRGVSGKWSALIREIERRRSRCIFRQHGEVNVRFVVAERASDLDAAVAFSAGASGRRVDEVSAIRAETVDDHEQRVRPLGVVRGVVFEIKPPLHVFADAERVAFAFLELGLIVCVDSIHAAGARRIGWAVHVGIAQPAEVALALRIVVRRKATAAAHHVVAVSVFGIRSDANCRAVARAPEVGVIPSEGVAGFVVENIHSIPRDPHAVAAAPRYSTQTRTAVHANNRAVYLIRIVSELPCFRTRVAVDKTEAIHFAVFRDVPRLRMWQRDDRRDRGCGGHPAVAVLEEKARYIPHIVVRAVLGVRRFKLIGVSDADVEAAEIANRLGRSSGMRVFEEAGTCISRRHQHRLVFLLQHADVGAVAQPNDAFADLHRWCLIGHRFLRRRFGRRDSRNRAQCLDLC